VVELDEPDELDDESLELVDDESLLDEVDAVLDPDLPLSVL
jgi:hypothetical protein